MKPNKNVNYPKRFDKLCCANKIRGLLKLLTARGGGGEAVQRKSNPRRSNSDQLWGKKKICSQWQKNYPNPKRETSLINILTIFEK
jgi:hypothetical protein